MSDGRPPKKLAFAVETGAISQVPVGPALPFKEGVPPRTAPASKPPAPAKTSSPSAGAST